MRGRFWVTSLQFKMHSASLSMPRNLQARGSKKPVSPQHRAQSGRGGPGPWPQEERQEKALLFLVRFHLHSLYLNVYHSEES